MSSSLRAHTKWVLLVTLTATLIAIGGMAMAKSTSVETYSSDDTVSSTPVKPGELTLQDIIEAHNAKAKAQSKSKGKSAAAAEDAVAPTLTPATKQSTEGVMLMQGLKSVLQEPENKTPTLQAPVLPGATAAASTAPATTPPAPTAGLKYEPGREPKVLGVAVPPQPSAPTTVPVEEGATVLAVSPAVSASSAKSVDAAKSVGDCQPHVEAWTKTCVDAGYPDSFTGEIRGETRVTCPAGGMHDVWVSNTCAPPSDDDDAEAKPAPAPVAEDTSAEDKEAPVPAHEAPALQPAATASVPVASNVRVDANCGASNGMALAKAPALDLCESGDATAVSGSGPWRWSCKGLNGGVSVSCAAAVDTAAASQKDEAPKNVSAAPKTMTVEDGLCGSSNSVGVEHPPVDNLCAKGMQSHVSGDGPWTWACSGMNGGTAAACSAPRKANGVCGSSNGNGQDEMPTADLCTAGYASAVTGTGPWHWTCAGLSGGEAATCSAAPKRDAVCGQASLVGHHEAPSDNLCSVGKNSVVSGSGPWLWTCDGSNGGSSVSCMAGVSVNGACGASNGAAFAEAPEKALCAKGKPSRVTGQGPWAWNCVGVDGGDTESCTATRAEAKVVAKSDAKSDVKSDVKPDHKAAAETAAKADDLCGGAAELVALEAPSTDLCKSGEATSVKGDGPWTWACADKSGHKSSCSTLVPGELVADAKTETASETKGMAPTPKAAPTMPVRVAEEPVACGSAADKGALDAPSDDLCAASAKASVVHGKGPWNWTCQKGKAKASCSAPKLIDAACGIANGSTQHSAPLANLCREGTATAVQGDGPWLWSCVGSGGGVSVSCSAASQALVRVDGACGVAASSPSPTTPTVNLCDGGVPSHVYGEGPWTWTCSGMNGGIASSCSTQRNVPPPPAPPGAVVNGLCGSSNGRAMALQPIEDLCDSGTATSVSGDGPWNWNCLGQNSGMTVSCTALLLPPSPITGVCGAASGVPTLTTPKSGLCSAGISSAVSGKGPWTWSCSGTYGGGAVACVAPMAGSNAPLPSLVTPSNEAPAPQPAAVSGVTKSGLVTPRLPTGSLPPVHTGSMPPAPGNFQAPKASAVPASPAVEGIELESGSAEPELPADAEPVSPPPVRDTIKPTPALKATGFDHNGEPVTAGRFTLDEEISVLSFEAGSDNIGTDELAKLDKLVNVLRAHGTVHITLTAYADSANSSPRDARRLSLSRALAVRDYLTNKGISSARVDVRALGANVPSGEPDRIDIKAN